MIVPLQGLLLQLKIIALHTLFRTFNVNEWAPSLEDRASLSDITWLQHGRSRALKLFPNSFPNVYAVASSSAHGSTHSYASQLGSDYCQYRWSIILLLDLLVYHYLTTSDIVRGSIM